uniref:Variant surface glycoprotein n=1 Tax=Trypanosoma brucei TaxID=5691 RepID=A0A1V0FZ69_9TRYP|nr:variant surface glycoprotein [Trypanosoma brucei]
MSCKTLVKAVIAAVIAAAATALGDEDTDVLTHVKDECHERIYGDTIRQEIKTWLREGTQAVNQLQDDTRLFDVAAARYAGTDKYAGYRALQIVAKQREDQAASDLKAKTARLADSLATISTKMGELAAFTAFTKTEPGANTPATTTGAGTSLLTHGSKKYCETTTTLDKVATLTCEPEGKKHDEVRRIRTFLSDPKKIGLRSTTALTGPTLKIVVDIAGSPSADNTISPVTGKSACYDGSTGSNALNTAAGIGIRQLTSTQQKQFTHVTIAEALRTGSNSDSARPENTIDLLTTDADLAASLAKIGDSKPTKLTIVTEESISSLSGDKTMQELAQALLDKKLTGTSEENLVATLFGGKNADMKKDFIDTLKADRTTIRIGDKTIEGSTTDLSKPENFATVMAYYSAQNLKKAAAASPGTIPEGNTKTDAADKTTEKKDVDNKTTTNTTASHSFVISKAPLLLAVLLF